MQPSQMPPASHQYVRQKSAHDAIGLRVARRAATAPTISHSSTLSGDADRVHLVARERHTDDEQARRGEHPEHQPDVPAELAVEVLQRQQGDRARGPPAGRGRGTGRGCGCGCGTTGGLRRRSWAWLRWRSREATRSLRRRLGILRSAAPRRSGDARGAGRRRRRRHRRSPPGRGSAVAVAGCRRRSPAGGRSGAAPGRLLGAAGVLRSDAAWQCPRTGPCSVPTPGGRPSSAIRSRSAGGRACSSRSTVSATSCGCAAASAGSGSTRGRPGDVVAVAGERRPLDDDRRSRVAWQHVVGTFDADWLGDVRPGGRLADGVEPRARR